MKCFCAMHRGINDLGGLGVRSSSFFTSAWRASRNAESLLANLGFLFWCVGW